VHHRSRVRYRGNRGSVRYLRGAHHRSSVRHRRSVRYRRSVRHQRSVRSGMSWSCLRTGRSGTD